jgi:hypothetical protein
MLSIAQSDLAAAIRTLLSAAGRNISPARAERAAAVVIAYPEHWRAWRPETPWEPTLDDLAAYRRALEPP